MLRDQLVPFCLLQWQYCPDNTGVAKRRRAKKASAAATAASEPAIEAHAPIMPSANDSPAHGQGSAPEMDQRQVQESLPGHWPTAESAGTLLGTLEDGKEAKTDTGPDQSSAMQPATKSEGLVSDPQQLPSQVPSQLSSQLPSQLPAQLPSWLSLPLPAIQPAAAALTELAHVSDLALLSDPAHVSDTSPRTCGNVEQALPRLDPGTLQLPAQLQLSRKEHSSHIARQPDKQEPTETSTKKSSAVQEEEDTDTPDHFVPGKLHPLTTLPHPSYLDPTQGVLSGAEDVVERTSFDPAGTPCEQDVHESGSQEIAALAIAQEAAPLPETQAHHGRLVQECSPEPRAASEGPHAVMGPEHAVQALHNAFALYAKSRSRSQDSQQQQEQPWQLSVPNPFRVSPEALQRPALPSTHLPASAQDSTQTPAQNCPARAIFRSMSPEALHVRQLGIADPQSPADHNNRCPQVSIAQQIS